MRGISMWIGQELQRVIDMIGEHFMLKDSRELVRKFPNVVALVTKCVER